MSTRTLTIGAVPHSFDGSSYYRMWLPFDRLDKQSIHITGVQRPGVNVPGPQDVDGLDVLVFQRPAGNEGSRMLERLVGYTKLVYEVDDDMLNVESSGLPHLADPKVKESVRRCMRLCDMVTVSCEHLADIYRPYNDNVVVIPNHIKAAALDIVRPRRDKVTVGWAGGTTHGWDMEEVRRPLRRVLARNDIDMHFIGADHSPILGRQCRWTRWNPDVGHYYKNVDFDIAVAPCADNLFNRSKTWIRALEMAALGIPVVASNRLPYNEFVVDGKTGFLVDNETEWADRIELLAHDETLRAEMGEAARDQARAWTIDDGWRLWEAAYERAANGDLAASAERLAA